MSDFVFSPHSFSPSILLLVLHLSPEGILRGKRGRREKKKNTLVVFVFSSLPFSRLESAYEGEKNGVFEAGGGGERGKTFVLIKKAGGFSSSPAFFLPLFLSSDGFQQKKRGGREKEILKYFFFFFFCVSPL